MRVDPKTGEIIEAKDSKDHRIRDLEDQVAGMDVTIRSQARKIGALERKLRADEEMPENKDVNALFRRWQEATGRKMTKFGKPRKKLVLARLRDGFPLTSEEAEPTLELAIDGIASHPYRVYDKRHKTGRPSDRHDDFDLALKDEKHVESLSRLGWKARSGGWTPEGGWPDE